MAKRSTNSQVGVTWQEVNLPIAQGVDLRSNDRAKPQARLARLVNGSFGERNSVIKRSGHVGSEVVIEGSVRPDLEAASDQEWVYGYGRFSPTQIAGWQPTQDQLLAAVTREDQLAVWTGDRLVAFNQALDQWVGESRFWDQGNGSGADEIETLPQGIPLFAPQGPVVDLPQRASQAGLYHSCAVGESHRLTAWAAVDPVTSFNQLWVRVETLDGTVVMDDYKVLTGNDRNGTPYDLTEDVGNMRAFWLQGYLCVVVEMLTPEDIILVRVPENDPLSGVLVDTLAGTATDVARCWDVRKVSDSLGLLAYRDGTDIKITYFRADEATVSSPADVATVLDLDTNGSDGALGIAVLPNGYIGLVWDSNNGTDPVWTCVYTEAGTQVDTATALDNTDTEVQRITVAALPVETAFAAYVEYADYVTVEWFNSADTDPVKYEDRFNTAIAGQAFNVGNIPFVTLVTKELGPVKQATYVLEGGITRPRIAGAWARSTAYSVPNNPTGTPPVVTPGDLQDLPRGVDFMGGQSTYNQTRWVLSFSHQPRYLKGDTVFMFTGAVTGVDGLEDGIVGRGNRDILLTEIRGLRVELDFTKQITWAPYGRSTYFSGAQPHVWDGEIVTEAGFLQWPEHISGPTVSNDAQAAWDTVDSAFPGLYRYRVYFCRRNRFGEVSRSPAITFPLSGSAAVSVPDTTSRVTLTMSTLEATEDEDVYYEVYRTLSGGTVYHLISGFDVTLATKNSREVGQVDIVDTVPDSLAADFPTDPHNPNPGFPVELEEVALPGCEILAAANDRLWFAGGGVPSGRLFYSKRQEPGEQAAWNDLGVLEYTLDNSTEPVTGVGDLSGQPLVFRASSAYSVGGDGPDNLGGGTYAVARRISTDLGAVNQFGVVKTSDGLGFWSAVGPRVVTESGAIAILGDEIAPAAVNRVPVASLVSPLSSQVRWYLDNGTALAYDYVVRFWAEHTGLDALAGTVWQGQAALVKPGKALFEDQSTYSDAGRPYEFLMRTSELRPEDLMQGASRVRRWAVSGLWRGAHALRTRVRFDGAEGVGEEFTWHPDADVGNEVWGTSDIWPGTQSSRDGVYRTRRRLKPRRVASISFEFSDGCAQGDSFVITELAMELGQKDGLSRLPSRSFT